MQQLEVMGRGLEALEPMLLIRHFAGQRIVLRAEELDGRGPSSGSGASGSCVAMPVAIPVLETAAERDPGLEAPAVLLVLALGEVSGGPCLPPKLVGGLTVDAL